MPQVPRDVKQEEAIRAFVRAGGIEIKGRGKGSHKAVQMPNGAIITLRSGRQPVGLIAAMLKQAGLTVEEFIDFL